jgi:hypothetical protein
MALIEWVVTIFGDDAPPILRLVPRTGRENTTYYRDSESTLLLVEYGETIVRTRKRAGAAKKTIGGKLTSSIGGDARQFFNLR